MNNDYIRGFNNGLIVGLTQKPVLFGLGVTNRRKCFSCVVEIPDDNYTINFINPYVNSSQLSTGGINWGDGNVEQWQSTSYCTHTYDYAGSYKITINSNISELNNAWNTWGLKYMFTQVSIPSNITVSHMFNQMTNLTNISIADGVTYIGPYCFEDTNIKSVTIPSTLNDAFAAFDGADLHTVTITDGLTTISPLMFKYTANIREITIPNSVQNIGYDAFLYSGITEITYVGTQMQWQDITIGSGAIPSGTVIHCTDGDITI